MGLGCWRQRYPDRSDSEWLLVRSSWHNAAHSRSGLVSGMDFSLRYHGTCSSTLKRLTLASSLVGVDIYDCVLVLNTDDAVRAFAKWRCTIGGEISAVAGPAGVGGILESEVHRRQAPVFTYLKSRGFYAGVQIDGTVIIERTDENERFYGEKIPARDIVAGKAQSRKYELRVLMETLRSAQGEKNIDRSLLPSEPPPADYQLMEEGKVFGIPAKEDPDPFGVLALEREGLEIREAGTKLRASSEQFDFKPVVTSPIYETFRRSLDSSTKRSSWRSSTFSNSATRPERHYVTSDVSTQTGLDPSVPMSPRSIQLEDHERSSIQFAGSARSVRSSVRSIDSSPKKLDHVHEDEEPSPPSSPQQTAPGRDSDDVEDDVIVHEVRQAPQVITKARMVTVPKRVPPKLPPRNPIRARVPSSQANGSSHSLDETGADEHHRGTSTGEDSVSIQEGKNEVWRSELADRSSSRGLATSRPASLQSARSATSSWARIPTDDVKATENETNDRANGVLRGPVSKHEPSAPSAPAHLITQTDGTTESNRSKSNGETSSDSTHPNGTAHSVVLGDDKNTFARNTHLDGTASTSPSHHHENAVSDTLPLNGTKNSAIHYEDAVDKASSPGPSKDEKETAPSSTPLDMVLGPAPSTDHETTLPSSTHLDGTIEPIHPKVDEETLPGSFPAADEDEFENIHIAPPSRNQRRTSPSASPGPRISLANIRQSLEEEHGDEERSRSPSKARSIQHEDDFS